MSLRRLASLLAVLTLASACATGAPAAGAPDADAAVAAGPTAGNGARAEPPAVLDVLPSSVGTFEYQGFRRFEDGTDGYSLRYANARKRRIADVYVYPVSKENLSLDHERLVLGSTRATMQAIGKAVRAGVYTDFNVVTAATRARGMRTVARVQATYLRENLASITVLYQTEHEGTLVKIRLSMPDNASNRGSLEWDRFAEDMFERITRDLDGTSA